MEPDVEQEFEGEEVVEGQDNITFGLSNHPITGEPILVLMLRDRNGGQASINFRIGDALNFGAQVTAQATTISVMTQMAQMQAAAQQNGGNRIILPGN